MAYTAESLGPKLERIVSRGAALPAMSGSSAELLNIGQHSIDTINIGNISELVEQDPGLAARILRVANSPVFGFSGKVTRIRHGITMIGLDEALSIIHFHILRHMMPDFRGIDRFKPDQFWLHSWACATIAKSLGRPDLLVRSSPGELYLAGLLHDVGKVVLAMQLPEDFGSSIQLAVRENIPLFEAERQILGADHAALAGMLLKTWNLPVQVLAGVGYHHAPQDAEPEHQEIASLVQFADILANQCGIGDGGNPREPRLDDAWFIKNTNSPLAVEERRQKMVEEIYETLKKKAEMIQASDVSQDGEEKESEDKGEEPARRPAAARPAPKPAKKKPGGLMGWLRSFFGD